jgi:Predicted integral membrane protein (DUF2269)
MFAVFDLYSLSLWLHISAAVVGLGATFALAVGFPLALKLDARYLPFVHHLSLHVNRKLASPALLVLLLTGIYQAIDADSTDEPWVGGTFLIVLILGGMQGAYFIPTDKKLAALAEKELAGGATTLSDDYQGQAQREGTIGAIAGVLIIVAVFLMVTKPGA